MEFLGCLFLVIGALFVLAGSVGVLRFEDVYLRIQFSSKSLTFGIGFFLAGAALLTPGDEVAWKAVVAIAFQFLTAPIAASMISQAAMKRGYKPKKMSE